ncbi:hypothetical protein HN681_01585 [archaeon]|mgnify:FL=1|jgi:hypothetical protein|nr:hypothetical protein [archaeon]MBT3731254.1 hypothetical protein [archaeon]MBT4669992.1 hypothetical protein [archaeon]MBT5287806.1 hypothetical protein [archaeon]MBT7053248.1 hypothetical protein [archaeon]
MKKIIFFLFLFLPVVSGLAVTPTSLDFGEVSRGEIVVRELLIINNENFPVEFEIEGFYDDSFILFEGESALIDVELKVIDKEDGDYEDYLVVKENYGSNLVNAVSIKVVYRVEGGDFSNENLNLEDVKVGDYGFSILYGIALVGLLGVGSFGYIRKKKFKKKGEL